MRSASVSATHKCTSHDYCDARSADSRQPRQRRNREATLPSQYRLLWETGRIDNLLRAAGQREGPFQGRVFNDSDIYKWLEAASWSLAAHPDSELRGMVDEVVPIVTAAQRPDGYLNSYFAREQMDKELQQNVL